MRTKCIWCDAPVKEEEQSSKRIDKPEINIVGSKCTNEKCGAWTCTTKQLQEAEEKQRNADV